MIHSDNDDTLAPSPLTQVSAVFLLLCLLAITAHFSGSQSALAVSESRSGNTFSHWHNDLSLAQPGIAWRFSAIEQERSESPKIGDINQVTSFPDLHIVRLQQSFLACKVAIRAFHVATFHHSQAPPSSLIA